MVEEDARLIVCDVKKCGNAFAYTLPPDEEELQQIAQWGFFIEQIGEHKWKRACFCPECRKKYDKIIHDIYAGGEEK